MSIVAVGIIMYKLDFQLVMGHIADATLWLLILALVFQILSQSVAAFRWHLIMDVLKFELPFSFFLKSYFKGSLFNQVLPTSVGGDAYRAAELIEVSSRTKDSLFGIFIDRVVGLTGLLLLNLGANLIESELLPDNIYYAINFIILSGFAGLAVLLLLYKIPHLSDYKLTRPFFELSENFRSIYRTPKRISQQVILSVVIHLFSMLAIFSIGISVGIDLPLTTYLVLIPPAILLTILPISFAGWGVREGAMIALFTLIGIDKSLVLAMSLLYGICLIVAALPGIYFLITSKNKYL